MANRIVIIIICLIIGFNVFSQETADSTQMWEITINDGNSFLGLILSETDNTIQFKTFAYGEIAIQKVLIKSRKKLEDPKYKKKKEKEKTTNTPSISSEGAMWRIVTDDGFDFVGKITEKNSQVIKLSTIKFGTIQIQRTSIKTMNIVTEDQMVGGDVWFENPQGTRYFYSPNGYGLKKGEGYYQNVWVLFNQASVGINDYFTIGLGTIPTFLFGSGEIPLWITPKVSIPIIEDKFNIGAGVMASTIFGGDMSFGLVYGVATYGDRNKNINLGFGYGFSDDGWADKPTISISAMARVSKKVYLISENFILSGEGETIVLLSGGGRTVWPRLSLDYGLIVPISEDFDGLYAIPWLGFVIPFGDSKKSLY